MPEIKVLTGFGEAEFNNMKRNLLTGCRDIQPFVDRINAINAYKIDLSALKNLLHGGGEMVANGVEAAVKADLESVWSEINSLGGMRISFEVGRLATVEDGKVFVPEAVIEGEVREKFCIYIRTEGGLRKKAEYDELISAANKFVKGNKTFSSINSIRTLLQFNVGQLGFDAMAAE